MHIDLNTVFTEAVVKATESLRISVIKLRQQVDALQDKNAHLERRIGLLEERMQANSKRTEFLEACAAGEEGAAEDTGENIGRIDRLRIKLEKRIEEVDRASASYAALVELEQRVDSLQRQVTAIDEANSKDAERFHEDVKAIVADVLNEGLAEAVADAFQNGSLTISVDKV